MPACHCSQCCHAPKSHQPHQCPLCSAEQEERAAMSWQHQPLTPSCRLGAEQARWSRGLGHRQFQLAPDHHHGAALQPVRRDTAATPAPSKGEQLLLPTGPASGAGWRLSHEAWLGTCPGSRHLQHPMASPTSKDRYAMSSGVPLLLIQTKGTQLEGGRKC